GLGKRSPTARESLKVLYRNPMVRAADLEAGLSVSPPTANALIKDLIRLGILVEITGQQRGRVYVFDRYLKLFTS
ncbi:MAG: Fic family protein, partial [Pseudomonadota bacterium]